MRGGTSQDEPIASHGWRLWLRVDAQGAWPRRELLAAALAAVSGGAPPLRRSRHASTWQARLASFGNAEVFVKLLDRPGLPRRVIGAFGRTRSAHVARITRALNDHGFLAPPILIHGREVATGRELIVAPQAGGVGPSKLLGERAALSRKRTILRALGREIARLHRCRFVHGDLTPFNIFVVRGEPPRFALIDHERTSRGFTPLRRYQQLRNLVQLGRFDLPGLTRADRMRVFQGYTEAVGVGRRRRLLRRVAAMLARRGERDRGAAIHDRTMAG